MPGWEIRAAVEGIVDAAVVKKLIQHAGGRIGVVHVKEGRENVLHKLAGYIAAARNTPWIVLVDLEDDPCAPALRSTLMNHPVPASLCFRVAVREVEAWLLADADRIAEFLSVAPSKIPSQPESLKDPKKTVVELAQMSRRREIREDMVPRRGSKRREGPAYTSRMVEFAQGHWRPDVAAQRADSLRRALADLRRIVWSPRSVSGSP